MAQTNRGLLARSLAYVQYAASQPYCYQRLSGGAAHKNLPPTIDRSHLLTLVAQLLADSESGLLIGLSLCRVQLLFGGPTRMGRWPAGEFPVPLLGIGMTQAVHFRQPGIGGVALVDPELLNVLPASGDQGAETGQSLGLFQQGALFHCADRDGSFPPALGPAGLELQVIATVCPTGLDLEGFLPSKSEGLLQPQAHPHVLVFHPRELVPFQVLGLAGVGHELPVRYAIKVVGAGNHAPLVNLLGPPA